VAFLAYSSGPDSQPNSPAISIASTSRFGTATFAVVGPLPTGSAAQGGRPITTSLEIAMWYLCLIYGTEDGLPVMRNAKPMSRAEGASSALIVRCRIVW
jgi:hypothetical protein